MWDVGYGAIMCGVWGIYGVRHGCVDVGCGVCRCGFGV